MVQSVALPHVPVLVSLVLGRDEHREHTRAELSANVLHYFAVGSTHIDTILSFEVCSEDTIVAFISTPPGLPSISLLLFHAIHDLGEQSVTTSIINIAVKCKLGSFEAINFQSYSSFSAFGNFVGLVVKPVLETHQQENVCLDKTDGQVCRGRAIELVKAHVE